MREEENAACSLFPEHSGPGRQEKAWGTGERAGGSDRYTVDFMLGRSQDTACFQRVWPSGKVTAEL